MQAAWLKIVFLLDKLDRNTVHVFYFPQLRESKIQVVTLPPKGHTANRGTVSVMQKNARK